MFQARYYLSNQERFFKNSKRFWEIMVWNVHFWHFYSPKNINENSFILFWQRRSVWALNFIEIKSFLDPIPQFSTYLFFASESAIFERFRTSAFQNTKHYSLTQKTRELTALYVNPMGIRIFQVCLGEHNFEWKMRPSKNGRVTPSVCCNSIQNDAMTL